MRLHSPEIAALTAQFPQKTAPQKPEIVQKNGFRLFVTNFTAGATVLPPACLSCKTVGKLSGIFCCCPFSRNGTPES